MGEQYFWHISSRSKAAEAAGFARVSADGKLDVIFLPNYPAADRDSSMEWLGFRLDGIIMCSEYEWWSYEDVNNSEYIEELGGDAATCQAWVVALFQEADSVGRNGMITLEAARTGSPLGRAGSVGAADAGGGSVG